MLLRVGSGLLVLWGLVNAVGGALGARAHPAPWVGALFVAVGVLIVAGGVAFWRERRWAAALSLFALLGLSAVALLSGLLLRGVAGMRLSHHVTRLLISAVILLAAITGARRSSSARQEEAQAAGDNRPVGRNV